MAFKTPVDFREMITPRAAEEFFASSESRRAFWKKLHSLGVGTQLSDREWAALEEEFRRLC